MALLDPRPAEAQHPDPKMRAQGYRIIGWLVMPDENYSIPDGIALIEAIEKHARLDFVAMKRKMLEVR